MSDYLVLMMQRGVALILVGSVFIAFYVLVVRSERFPEFTRFFDELF